MLKELNELEKVGLAFLAGLVAGGALEEADLEVENEEKEKNNTTKVAVGKIEGEKAEKFIKMMKDLGVE